MLGLVGFWSHALAACLYGALAVWQLRHWNSGPHNRKLVAAFAVMALWGIFVALRGPHDFASGIAESARNFAFLAFMYGLVRGAADPTRQRGAMLVYFAVAGVIGLQIIVAGVLPRFEDAPVAYAALTSTAQIIGFTISAGALVLVHNLYGQAAPGSRWGIRLPMLALAAMWVYDLHLYTIGYLSRAPVDDLLAMRGAIAALLVPLFALASRRSAEWKMRMSRAATFQSLSVIAILGYLILMMSATQALALIGGNWVRTGQVGLIFAMTIAATILLPSGKARAWLRVMLAKHLFEHRYDYRQEWLGFTRTIGLAGEDAPPLSDRILKALADIADAPGGLLLLPDERHNLAVSAEWNWTCGIGRSDGADGDFVRFVEARRHVVDFDADRERIAVPAWLTAGGGAWAGIPLLHNDRLVGLVILEHPFVRRALDWEDFDLFRTAGIQAASYLAEAQSQEALGHAHRFDEFNRRFAFIMHDIKNLVSQLSLVARNAERHADNPEFRADMIATLQSSVKKMNDLLARLSRGNSSDAQPLRAAAIHPLLAAIARDRPVNVSGDPLLSARADPAGLEQAIRHIVQNGLDASAPGDPVTITYRRRGAEVAIAICDTGAGMPADFVRGRLFQPFASTKQGGFGIGAFEAKSLIAAMGGRIEVESREGEGSRFTIFLPAGEAPPAEIERMRA